MRYIKWLGLAAALLLIITCFIPWVIIPSKNIVVSGTAAIGTNFGKPGYFNLVMVTFFYFFHPGTTSMGQTCEFTGGRVESWMGHP